MPVAKLGYEEVWLSRDVWFGVHHFLDVGVREVLVAGCEIDAVELKIADSLEPCSCWGG